jgi:hypothetical protein
VSKSTIRQTYTAVFLAIVVLSSATMLWLFWRFPLRASLGTLGVLFLFGIAAHLSRSSDTDIAPSR